MITCEICAAVVPDPTSSVYYCTTKKDYVNKDNMRCESFRDRDDEDMKDEEEREITAEDVERVKEEVAKMLFLTDRKSHYPSLPPPKIKKNIKQKNKKHVKRMKGAVVHCDFNLKREKKAVK